jgi:hypothetical protein
MFCIQRVSPEKRYEIRPSRFRIQVTALSRLPPGQIKFPTQLPGTAPITATAEPATMSKAEEARKGLTEEQIADLKEAFAMFDINGDGAFLIIRKRMCSQRAPNFSHTVCFVI